MWATLRYVYFLYTKSTFSIVKLFYTFLTSTIAYKIHVKIYFIKIVKKKKFQLKIKKKNERTKSTVITVLWYLRTKLVASVCACVVTMAIVRIFTATHESKQHSTPYTNQIFFSIKKLIFRQNEISIRRKIIVDESNILVNSDSFFSI